MKLKENMSRRSRHGSKVERWDTHQQTKFEARKLRSGRKVKLKKEVGNEKNSNPSAQSRGIGTAPECAVPQAGGADEDRLYLQE